MSTKPEVRRLAEMLERSEDEILRLVQGKKLRPDEVAEFLNVSKRSVYDLVQDGLLLGFKVKGSLRIPQAALENFVAREIARSVYDTGFCVRGSRSVTK